MNKPCSQGFTLVELVVAIVVIAAAGATLVGLLAYISKRSAEDMAVAQSATLAQAYLGEIMGQPFNDPGGPPEAGRNDFDDIADYAMSNAAPTDRFGNALPNLSAYSVSVQIQQVALGAIPAPDARRITVTVTDPFGDRVVLSAFKTAHP